MDAEWISLIEVAILGATLLTTVGLSLFIALQARRHFQLRHAKDFIARFNAAEMVKIRNKVDRWLARQRDPYELIVAEQASVAPEVNEASIAMRTFINFFQELGVGWKHGTVHKGYTWDLFGGLVAKYWNSLAPYCRAQRAVRGRPSLYCDFEKMVAAMAAIDKGQKTTTAAMEKEGQDEVYLFGYGSLISPDSAARTLGRQPDRVRLRLVWLNGYERGWSVYDKVQFDGQQQLTPTAFLNLTAHPGRRCNGVAIPVKREDLLKFDQRERNYRRVDVSTMVTPQLDKPVYTYFGKAPWTDLPEGTVIAEKYSKLVEDAVGALGSEFIEDYQRSTAPHALPVQAGDYAFAASTDG